MQWNEKQLHILSVAESLFAVKGYEGTSVREIANAADVNVSMISYYFGSKEELFYNLIKNRAEQNSDYLDKLKEDKSISSWEKLEKVIDRYVDVMFRQRSFHLIYNRQISFEQNEKFTKLLIEIKKRRHDMLVKILEEGVRQGTFHEVDKLMAITTITGVISQVTLSRTFMSSLIKVPVTDEQKYYDLMTPRVKKYLKELLSSMLLIKSRKK